MKKLFRKNRGGGGGVGSDPPSQAVAGYVLPAVAFGDRPSRTIAMVALQSIAEMNRSKYGSAADMIMKNSYVDDLIQSVAHITDALTLAENVQCILEKGGFKIKHWIMSGEEDVDVKSKIDFLTRHLLGYFATRDLLGEGVNPRPAGGGGQILPPSRIFAIT